MGYRENCSMRASLKSLNPLRRRLLLGATAVIAGSMLSRSGAWAAQEASGGRAGSPSRPIEVGLIPYLPTATLIARHQPLRRHFEETFQRPAVLSTAPDFHTFQQRVLNGDFDFIVTGPGPGWQAHVDRKQQVIAVSRRQVKILFVVAKDSPVASFTDLRGKTVVTIAALTLTGQATVAHLKEHKLQPDVDVDVRYEKTPFNCAQGVILGEVAAAGLTSAVYSNLPAETREKLRIFHESESFPGILFMVRPAADMPRPEEFQAALFRFAHDTEPGRAFLKDLNHDGLLTPDPKALRMLDRFVPETRRAMNLP
jgi:ABC-type phosphate/phosphonate transport system substrate-binding protein